MSCGTENGAQGDAQLLMPLKDKTRCQRCRDAKSRYIVRNVTMCWPCFEMHAHRTMARVLYPPLQHAGKATALMNRPPQAAGDVLVALSGGAGSTALLDLVADRAFIGDGRPRDLTKGDKSLLWAWGWAVHVDFSSITGLASRADDIRRFAEDRGCRFVLLRAEDAFDPALGTRLRAISREATGVGATAIEPAGVSVNLSGPELPLLGGPSSPATAPLESLKSLLASLPSPSRPAILQHILDSLLSLVAHSLPNISHLLVGETSTREAQRVISGTALGRGWALPLELAPSRQLPALASSGDAAGGGTAVVRIKPMKDLSVKEAALWCHGRGLATVNARRWDSTVPGQDGRRDARGKGATGSIEALTERFIASLNVSHPSTVNTINRTGNKLHFAGQAPLPDQAPPALCPVCEMPADPSPVSWKAEASLISLPRRGAPAAFAGPAGAAGPSPVEPAGPTEPPAGRLATAHIPGGADTAGQRPSAPVAAGSAEPAEPAERTLAPLLCYACLTAFTPLTAAAKDQPPAFAPVPLPIWVGERVAERRTMSAADQRAHIAEFIIDDE